MYLSRTLLAYKTGHGNDHLGGVRVNVRTAWQWLLFMIYVTLWHLRSDTPVM